MNLPWGDQRTTQFITNVGLITSNGAYGNNIMAAEWTHQISYEPGLIVACLKQTEATYANISETQEFGVNLAAAGQNVLSSIAGGSTGKNVDKVEALKELGFKFFSAKKINVLMVEGAAMNAECKLLKKIELGDHTVFVGEIVELYQFSNNDPLIYHRQKYWKIGENIAKPSQQELDRIKSIVEKHKK